jgi:hypothetical protein
MPRNILVTTIDIHCTVVQYDVSYTRADRSTSAPQEKRCRPGRSEILLNEPRAKGEEQSDEHFITT